MRSKPHAASYMGSRPKAAPSVGSKPDGILLTWARSRTRQPGMIQALTGASVGNEIRPLMDYLDTVKEQRTGMSRASQGLDANSLQSSTASAVSATVITMNLVISGSLSSFGANERTELTSALSSSLGCLEPTRLGAATFPDPVSMDLGPRTHWSSTTLTSRIWLD